MLIDEAHIKKAGFFTSLALSSENTQKSEKLTSCIGKYRFGWNWTVFISDPLDEYVWVSVDTYLPDYKQLSILLYIDRVKQNFKEGWKCFFDKD
ncbi:MAG: hypothetical protein WB502_05515 [Thermoactinomyces sp.]